MIRPFLYGAAYGGLINALINAFQQNAAVSFGWLCFSMIVFVGLHVTEET